MGGQISLVKFLKRYALQYSTSSAKIACVHKNLYTSTYLCVFALAVVTPHAHARAGDKGCPYIYICIYIYIYMFVDGKNI